MKVQRLLSFVMLAILAITLVACNEPAPGKECRVPGNDGIFGGIGAENVKNNVANPKNPNQVCDGASGKFVDAFGAPDLEVGGNSSSAASSAASSVATTPSDYRNPTPVVVISPASSASSSVPSQKGKVPEGIKAVGNKVLDPCKNGPEPKLQVEVLKENGKPVANAYSMLDLNEDEVTSGLRYVFVVPQGSYVHLFVAINDDNEDMNDYTWEMHGRENALAVATAATIWCKAGNWNAANAGKARLMNALSIPQALRDVWITVGPRGVMPTSK